jgi:PAS domain S-box-containing protein
VTRAGVSGSGTHSVAVLAPSGSDAPLAARMLQRHGVVAQPCGDMTALCDALEQGAGTLLIAEEALGRDDRVRLLDALDRQPRWSDVPIVLLVVPGELTGALSPAVQEVVQRGNVTLLERPVRVLTLATALEASLRSRARQLEVRDAIAERARSEREARASEMQLRAAVEAAPYPLMLHTDEGRIIQLSRTWTDLTGYRPDELQTMDDWTRLAYGADAPLALAVIRDDFASPRAVGESAAIWEHAVRTRDGGERTWSFHAAKLGRQPDGRLLRLVAAVDVTDMRRLLANERTLREEAEEANRAKMQFLATMSHELRTPLNAIGGHVQLMELGILGAVTERQRDALQRVRRAEAHLLGLINDVLNFAKIEAGRVTFELAPMTLGELFEGMEALVAPQVEAKGLTYSRNSACDDVRVTADREKGRQVLLNLLSNAVKFTAAGGRISVSCAPRGEMAEIRVSDTGIGVPPEAVESIFEPFVQVRREYTTTHEGTGLGLAISRDLARAMGGDLTVQSTPGEGSIFIFTLPLADAPGKGIGDS